jgi:hypothetical protein
MTRTRREHLSRASFMHQTKDGHELRGTWRSSRGRRFKSCQPDAVTGEKTAGQTAKELPDY